MIRARLRPFSDGLSVVWRMEMATEIYLARHGKTIFNTVGRLQGWSDSPLTAEGRTAAAALGGTFARRGIVFDTAVTSTAARAQDTAGIILQHAGQPDLARHTLDDLRECCFGGFEGERVQTVYAQLAARQGYPDAEAFQTAFRQAGHFMLPDAMAEADPLQLAENHRRFTARIGRAMTALATLAANRRRILAVSHGMAVTAILKSIDPAATGYHSVPNLSVSRLTLANGRWRIDSVGEIWQTQAN